MTSSSHSNINPASTIDHPKTSLDLQEGDAFYFQSRYTKANEIYQTILEQLISSPEPETAELTTVYHKLGLSSLKLAKFSDAHRSLSKALELLKSKEENNTSLELVRVLHAIGETYGLEANYPEAEEHLLNAIKIIKEDYGEEHRELAVVSNKLANLYEGQRKAPEALDYLEKAVKISLLQNPHDEVELAAAYLYFARVYDHLDNYDQVRDYINKSLQLTKQIYGDNHVEIAVRYTVLGDIEKYESRLPEAMMYYEKSQKMLVDILGDNCFELADCYSSIGHINHDLKDYKKSIANFQQALKIENEFLPANHPHLGYTYGSFAETYKASRDVAKALYFYHKAVNILSEKLGETHPELVSYLEDMAELYRGQEQYSLSRRLTKKQIVIELKTRKEKDSKIADLNNLLGISNFHEHKYKKALKYFLEAEKISECLSKKKFAKEATYLSNMGWTLETVGNTDSLESATKKSLKCLQKLHGKDHQTIRDTLEILEDSQKQKQLQDINYNFAY